MWREAWEGRRWAQSGPRGAGRRAQYFVKPTIRRTRAKDNVVFYRGVHEVRRALRVVLAKNHKRLGF